MSLPKYRTDKKYLNKYFPFCFRIPKARTIFSGKVWTGVCSVLGKFSMTDCLIRIKNFISELSKQKSIEIERTFHFKGRSQGDNLNHIIFILYFFCDGNWYVILLLLQGMWATGGRGGGEGRRESEDGGGGWTERSVLLFCNYFLHHEIGDWEEGEAEKDYTD